MNSVFVWVGKLWAVIQAAKNDPALWAAIQDLWSLVSKVPSGAQPELAADKHQQVQALIDKNPAFKAALQDAAASHPSGPQAIGIGDVGTLLALLQQLWTMFGKKK